MALISDFLRGGGLTSWTEILSGNTNTSCVLSPATISQYSEFAVCIYFSREALLTAEVYCIMFPGIAYITAEPYFHIVNTWANGDASKTYLGHVRLGKGTDTYAYCNLAENGTAITRPFKIYAR